jgi:CBS domain containing-hemolysin-like protein
MIPEYILLFVLLIFSALFSASEIALVVANKGKLQVRARKKKFGASIALSLVNSPEKFLSTVLVGNNIVNITLCSIAAIFLQHYFHSSDTFITITVALVILLFGELIPKSLVRLVADAVVSYAALFLELFRIVLFPFIWCTQESSRMIVSALGFQKSTVSRFLHKRDFEILLKESEEVGAVGREEGKKIIKVITLSDVLAKDVMKARANIVAVDIKSSVKQALQVLVERGYSKLLVYDQTIDNIVGLVFARDFFTKPRALTQILRDVVFVPETKNCSDLFRDFRLKKISLAVVVDEFGGTAGVVASEDILEEFLGEITDEQTDDQPFCRRLPDGALLLSGKVEIKKLQVEHGLEIPDGPYDTVAGFIMHSLGRIPSEKEEFRIGDVFILILRASKTRIEMLKIRHNVSRRGA